MKKENQTHELHVAALTGGGTEDNPYLITSVEDFYAYAKICSSTVVNVSNLYTNACAKLTADLDFNGDYEQHFQNDGLYPRLNGVFDGNGKTIKNINVDGNELSISASNCMIGLFPWLGPNGKIKNLKIKNFSLFFNAGIINEGGAILCNAIESGGVVENCIFENVKVKSNGFRTDCQIGIIAYASSGTVKNCLVKSVYMAAYNKNFIVNPDGMDCYVFVHENSGTIQNCVFQGPISISSDSAHTDTTYLKAHTDMPETCKNTTGYVTSDKESTGGTVDETGYAWYYGGSQYNDGWPCLRIFMNWKTIKFGASPSDGGSVNPTSVNVPHDADYEMPEVDATFVILNQTITASASTGYDFDYWSQSGGKYKAHFTLKTYTISFGDAIGVMDGDSVENPADTTYTVTHGKIIESSSDIEKGKFIIKYSFYDGKNYHDIEYSMPENYDIESYGTTTITGDTVIQPTVKIRTFKVILKGSSLSNNLTDTVWNVNYGDSITYDSLNISFTYLDNTITYIPKYSNLGFGDMKINNTSITEHPEYIDTLSNITKNLTIYISFVRYYNVMFAPINEYSAEPRYMKVKDGDTISCTLTNFDHELTYSYNEYTVKYRAKNKFYILSNESNDLTIRKDTIITPREIFYACAITIDKNAHLGAATLEISGDEWETADDGTFIVAFGTRITFTTTIHAWGLIIYTYRFSSGEVIRYMTIHPQYAMQYELDTNGERMLIKNSLSGEVTGSEVFILNPENSGTSKTISPEFGRKQYAGQLG